MTGRLHSPEWIVMLISVDENERANIMPAGWAMHCSGSPPYVAAAVGYERYTYRCIHHTRRFVFAWAGEGQGDLVAQTGSTSGRDIDKFTAFSVPAVASRVIGVPLLAGAASNLECRLVHEYPSGDHAIFVGEIVATHVTEPPVRRLFNFGREFFVAVADQPER